MYQFIVSDRQRQNPETTLPSSSYLLNLAGAATFLLILVALLMMGAPSIVAAQPTPLTGNHPPFDAAAINLQASATRPLNIHISFAPRNPAGLTKLLADLQNPASPRFHRWLTPAAFVANFGRTPGEVSAVQQWLFGQGFRIVESSPRGLSSIATVAQAESTFALRVLASPDGSSFANASDPKVPARLAALIGSIEGLDNTRHSLALAIRPPASRAATIAMPPHRAAALRRISQPSRGAKSAVLIPAAVTDYNSGLGLAFGPADLWTFYDETPLLNAGTDGGAGGCVAVVEDTDYYGPSVTLFDSNFSLPVASVTRVLADGANPGRNADEVEALLDIEWAHAVAPGAAISVYIGNPATAPIDPLVSALKQAVTDNKCSAISVSYGFCGASASFFTGTLDPIFAQAAAQGQSVFISSGDQGAADIVLNTAGTACVVGKTRNVSEMAADPNVIAVGGTEFTPSYDGSNNDIGSTAESVWNDATGASGGGASAVFGKPTWQVSSTPADARRDVPDVSLGASPISPGFYWGDDTGGAGVAAINCCIGGTSIAAPMWAGLAKVLAQATGTRLGNMNPRIYTLGARHDESVSGLRDVTVGNNSYNGVNGFAAVAAYDQATGWGSIDMAAFAAAYPVATPTPTPSPSPTPTPTPIPTVTPSPTPTVTPSPSPTPSPTPIPSPTPTPVPLPTATPTPTPTPTPGPAKFTPKGILFGPHKVGTESPARGVVILNPLRNKSTLTIGTLSFSEGNFVIDGSSTTCTNGAILARGARCRIGVRFAPSTQGLLASTLIVNDSAGNSPHLIMLHGKGM